MFFFAQEVFEIKRRTLVSFPLQKEILARRPGILVFLLNLSSASADIKGAAGHLGPIEIN